MILKIIEKKEVKNLSIQIHINILDKIYELKEKVKTTLQIEWTCEKCAGHGCKNEYPSERICFNGKNVKNINSISELETFFEGNEDILNEIKNQCNSFLND